MRGALLVLAGCGRIAFDPLADPLADAQTDAFASGADANPDLIDLTTFDPQTCASTIMLVGDAKCIGGVLELTPDLTARAGAAYLGTRLDFASPTAKLDVFLTLQFPKTSTEPSGDGLVFVVHDDPRGTAAIGSGGTMGYAGITPSIGIEVDAFDDPPSDPNNNHIGIDADGDVSPSLVTQTPPFDVKTSITFNLWLAITPTHIDVYADTGTTRPGTPLLVLDHDVARLGDALIGITAGTGTVAEAHHVLAWRTQITR